MENIWTNQKYQYGCILIPVHMKWYLLSIYINSLSPLQKTEKDKYKREVFSWSKYKYT